MPRDFDRVLVVEDDAALCAAIARIVSGWGELEVQQAATAAQARSLLAEPPPPNLLIIDVRLPDETAFGVLEAARQLSPAPLVVAMSGKASPDEAFRLAQAGVRAYLPKPFSIQDLASTVEAACSEAPDLEPMITAWVGRVPMRELQREVRRVMVKEALAQTEGSRSGAARLLHVTRQAVQQMLRSKDAPAAAGPEPRHGTRPLASSPPRRRGDRD
jgi:two-component system response regulator RegA